MHDQRNPDVADDEAGIDRTVLDLLLEDGSQRLWAVEEVAREVGEPDDTRDALARLRGAGLVHQLDRFVFATRPALRAGQLAE